MVKFKKDDSVLLNHRAVAQIKAYTGALCVCIKTRLQLRLLSRSVILMNDTADSGLVKLFNGNLNSLVCIGSLSVNSGVSLFDSSAQRGTVSLIALIVHAAYKHALF